MKLLSYSRTHNGFTLVEVLIACTVLSLFLAGAYTLFFGGQKVAGRAAWLQYAVTDLRKTEMVITKAIQATSYPSTLGPSSIFDAGVNSTSGEPGPNAKVFYTHVSQGTGLKTAKDIIETNSGISLYMPACTPEKQGFSAGENCVGTLTWNIFKMEKSTDHPDQGTYVWEERVQSYTTSSPKFAESFTANYTAAPLRRREVLVRNVQSIDIQVASISHLPSKITITITATYPRDPKLLRTGTSAAVSNVGTTIAP